MNLSVWRQCVRLDRPGRWLVAVTAFGLVLRLGWLWYALRTPIGLGDPQFYMQTAQSIADGHGYVGGTGQVTALWPPGYSFALAVAVWFSQHTFLGGSVVQAAGALNLVLGTVTVALVGVLGRRVLGPRCGVAAAAIVAVFPSMVMLTGAVLSETVFNFFNVIVLLLLLWSPWRNDDGAIALPSDRVFLIAGAVAGLAILTRPPFAVSVVLVPIAIAVTARNWRVSLMRTGALLLGVFLVVAPWTARNAVTMNSFVPISTNTGYNLCMGHNPESSGTFAIPDYCFRDLPTDDTTKSEVQRDALTRSRAVHWMSGHILDEPRLALLKTWYLFADDQAGLDASRSYGNDNWLQPRDLGIWNTICDGYFFAVLGLAILGFLTWPIAGDRRRLVMLLLVAGVVVAVWLFFGDSRFKQPMLPILAIAAVVPLRALRHPPTAAVADAAAVPDESSPRTR